jgi:hypothetical protein
MAVYPLGELLNKSPAEHARRISLSLDAAGMHEGIPDIRRSPNEKQNSKQYRWTRNTVLCKVLYRAPECDYS